MTCQSNTHARFHRVNFKCVHYKWIKGKSQSKERPIPVSHINQGTNTHMHARKSPRQVVPASRCFWNCGRLGCVPQTKSAQSVQRGPKISTSSIIKHTNTLIHQTRATNTSFTLRTTSTSWQGQDCVWRWMVCAYMCVCVCVTTPTTKEIWRHKNNILASRTFLAIRLDCPVSPNARPGFFSQCSGNSKLPHSLNSSLRKNPTANNQGLNTMTGTQRQVNSPGINRDYFSFHPIFILSILNSWPPGQGK